MRRGGGDRNTVRPMVVEGEVCGLTDGEGEAPGEEKDEATAERRRPRRVADPRKPSAAEVQERELARLPYRNWCRACVQGRG